MCQHPHAHTAAVPARQHDLVQARRVRGFRFTESKHSDFIPPHTHAEATITVLLAGTFEESYGLSTTACWADSVLYRPAGEVHADRFGRAGAHNFVIEIDAARAQTVADHANILNEVVHLRNPRLMSLVHQMRAELHTSDTATALALEGLAMAFIAQSIRVPRMQTTSSDWLQRAEELLRDRFRDEGIQMRALAEEVGVHPVHFARAFKARYGLTPGQFLRRLRIRWAAEQLRTTPRSLADIALDAGYADQSHFGRAFKRQFGMPPSIWRRYHQA